MSVASRSRSPLPALGNHVGRIIGRQAEEQMVRPDAGRVVARMADEHAVRDRAVMNLPGYAVGKLNASIALANHEGSIPADHAVSRPCPAAVRLADLFPEAFEHRARAGAVVAILGAVLLASPAPRNMQAALEAVAVRLPAGPRARTRAELTRHAGRGLNDSAALLAGTLNGHRAYSSVSGLGQLTLRRGHFVPRFYHLRAGR